MTSGNAAPDRNMQPPAFTVSHAPNTRTRRRPLVCNLDSRPTPPRTQPQPLQTKLAQVPRLRLLKLSLLLSDLHFRVNTHHAHPSLHPPLSSISNLSTTLLVPPPPPQSTIREALWDLRAALEPFHVSHYTRESLELARACALHVPKQLDLEHELHTLSVETSLLAELKELRGMVTNFVNSLPQSCEKSHILSMAAELGIDEYRVRGKTKLENAIRQVVLSPCVPEHVSRHASRVASILRDSLEEDLQVSPVGEAMLLRPRVVDIPNFAVVNNNFLRGGQPNRGGLEWLQQYGVSVVVDLRGSDRENQWIPHCRVLQPGNNGSMRCCNIPVEDFCTPSYEQVYEFLDLVERLCRDGVLFVHCKAGIGRTGTFVACWRVSKGVDVEEALAMEQLYSEGGGGLRQEAFVREFARRWNER